MTAAEEKINDTMYCSTGNIPVTSWFTPKVIHLQNDEELGKCIKWHIKETSVPEAFMTLADYYVEKYDEWMAELYGKLNIEKRSIAVEIIGHVYPEKLAKYLPDSVYKAVRAHTAVIDMGERSVDDNRIVWDGICYAFDSLTTPTDAAGKPMPFFVTPSFPETEMSKYIAKKMKKDIDNGSFDPLLATVLLHR